MQGSVQRCALLPCILCAMDTCSCKRDVGRQNKGPGYAEDLANALARACYVGISDCKFAVESRLIFTPADFDTSARGHQCGTGNGSGLSLHRGFTMQESSWESDGTPVCRSEIPTLNPPKLQTFNAHMA